MKIFNIVSFVLFLLTLALPIYCQENTVVPRRTPEQEAAKQTEKLQQELNLNQTQVNSVYEINLRYARERQISNKRSEALERMKNKNAEIKQVLNPEQNDRLQTKRYERTYLETNTLNRNRYTNSTGFRSSPNFHSGQQVRGQASSNMNIRNNNRPVNPNFHPRSLPYQTTRRSTNTFTPLNHFQNNSSSSRSSSGNLPNATRRTETPVNPNRK